MRTITEENAEFGTWDQQQQDSYIFNTYPACFPGGYSWDAETGILTVQIRYVEELNRYDLVPISEPLIALHIIQGIYSEQYMQENYPDCYGKTVYPDATGHSLRLIDENNNPDAFLTVWFD